MPTALIILLSISYLPENNVSTSNLFNSFYASNKVLTESDSELQKSWLGLSQTTYKTIEELLDILAIDIPEKM